MASIRDKGRCPCPRCLIQLKDVGKLGTANDTKQRKTLARMDDTSKHIKIEKAREHIYLKKLCCR